LRQAEYLPTSSATDQLSKFWLPFGAKPLGSLQETEVPTQLTKLVSLFDVSPRKISSLLREFYHAKLNARPILHARPPKQHPRLNKGAANDRHIDL
jgi:hypothetical protein